MPRRTPAARGVLQTRVEATRAASATNAPLPLSPSASEKDSGGLAAIDLFLISTFAASGLLLAFAAMPPAWTVRVGFPVRLVSRREELALFGAIILLESGVLALLAST